MPDLDQIAVLIKLLADVGDRKVLQNEFDGIPYLDLPGEHPADVGLAIWTAEKAGWCWLPGDTLVWHLTDKGREVLDRGAP